MSVKYMFFDVETTGVNKEIHGIHQISGRIVIDGEVKEKFDFKVAPHPAAKIEPKALEVGGVTEEQIRSYPSMNVVYRQLVNMLSKYCNRYDKKDKIHLVGYNNQAFDNSFLNQFFIQNDDVYFWSWFWSGIDVLSLAAAKLVNERHKMDDFKLGTVAKYLGIETDPNKLHDADYDIELTYRIFLKLTE